MNRPSGRILLVDDEPTLLKMMGVFLERMGLAVESADSTQQALARVEAEPASFDVAVLDATMPGVPLYELAIRMLRANPLLRIVAASGYPVDVTEMEAAAPGRVVFLQKPFSPEMLAKTVRRMLASQEEDV